MDNIRDLIERILLGSKNTMESFLASIKVGGDADKKKSGQIGIELEKISAGLWKLLSMFQYTTPHDKLLLFIGVIFTAIHASSFPVLAVLFGNACEHFAMGFSIEGSNQNSTTNGKPMAFDLKNSDMTAEDMFNSFGKYIGLSQDYDEPQELMSKAEYLAYCATLSMYLAIIGAVVLVASFIQTVCWESAAASQIIRIRQNFVTQILRQDVAWFENKTFGYLVVKLTDDIERMREGIGRKFGLVVEYSICFVVGIFFALCTNWKLTLIFASSTPFIIGKMLCVLSHLASKSIEQQEQYGRIGAISAEVLQQPRTVAAFGTELDETLRYSAEQDKGYDTATLKYKMLGFGIGMLYLLIFGSYALAFMYACHAVASGAISPKEVYIVFFCVSVGVLGLLSILPFLGDIASAYGCSKIIKVLIESIPNIDPYTTHGQRPHKSQGKITFSNVTFSYPSRLDTTVLRDLSFTIAPGENIGIVGPSGGGKSTLIQLLLRFHDPQSGQISFDDVDLRNLNPKWLRDQIGYVTQKTVIENTTVLENITGGRKGITMADAIRVAKVTLAHSFIQNLPHRYNTVIDGSQTQLSNGEKQLLVATRALIRNPPILLLDECLSTVDSQTAAQVAANIIEFRKGRTSVIITPRLARIQLANRIFILKNGKIDDIGTHEELLAKSGLYYEMAVADGMIIPEGTLPPSVVSDTHQRHGTSKTTTAEKDETFDLHIKKEPKPTAAPSVRVHWPEFIIDFEKWKPAQLSMEDFYFPSRISVLIFLYKNQMMNTFVFGILGCLISGLVVPAYGYVSSQLFIVFTEPPGVIFADSILWIKMLVAVGVAAAVGFCLKAVFINTLGEFLTVNLREDCYLSILRQSMSWFDEPEHSPNKLHIRLASDAPIFKSAIGTGLGTAISTWVGMFCALIFTVIYAWQLSLVLLLVSPLYIGSVYFQIRSCERNEFEKAVYLEPSLLLAYGSFGKVATIQGLTREERIIRKYVEFIHPVLKLSLDQAMSFGIGISISESIAFFLLASILRFGIYLNEVGSLDSVTLFTVFILLTFNAITIGHITAFAPDYVKAKIAFGYIFKFYDIDSRIDSFETLGEYPQELGRISFENITFGYPLQPDIHILQNFSLTIEPGTCVGIIGRSGKSTILSLIERFYDITAGKLTFGGVDNSKVKLNYLRANIGYVPQEPKLFNSTILYNITYGFNSGDLSDDEIRKKVEEVSALAGMGELIAQLPDELDTIVGDLGARLTGGDRQRIIIARALIRDPKILLLDEPTCGLGPKAEQELLPRLCRSVDKVPRTTILVSNSSKVVRHADVIAVLKDGQVAEYGTPAQLIAKRGMYYELTCDDTF